MDRFASRSNHFWILSISLRKDGGAASRSSRRRPTSCSARADTTSSVLVGLSIRTASKLGKTSEGPPGPPDERHPAAQAAAPRSHQRAATPPKGGRRAVGQECPPWGRALGRP